MSKKFITINTNGQHVLTDALNDATTSVDTGWSSEKTLASIKTDAITDFVAATAYLKNQVIVNPADGVLYRVAADYTSSAAIDTDITSHALFPVGGSTATGEDIYNYMEATAVDVGGLPAGTTLTGDTIAEIIHKMANPEMPASVSLTTNPATTLREAGEIIASVTLSATTVKKTSPIASVEFLKNNVHLYSVPAPNADGGAEAYVDNTGVTENTTYTCKVTDTVSRVTTSTAATYNFVYPIYVGAVDNAGPSEAIIKAMTKLIKTKSDTTNSYTITNKRFCIAFPKSYGLLSGIKDPNVFEIIGDFTKTEVTMTMLDMNPIDYVVYTYDNVVTVSNFAVTYKF